MKIEPSLVPADHIFLSTKDISVGINIYNSHKKSIQGSTVFTVYSDFGEFITSETTSEKTIKPGKNLSETIHLDKLQPGFYTITAHNKNDLFSKKVVFAIGVKPEEIVSPANRPSDFEAYWRRAKDELACIDPQYKLIKQDSLCTAEREVYLVEMRSLGNILIRGWRRINSKQPRL